MWLRSLVGAHRCGPPPCPSLAPRRRPPGHSRHWLPWRPPPPPRRPHVVVPHCCCPVVVVVPSSSSCCHCRLVLIVSSSPRPHPAAPHFHPTSSGLRAWLGVQSWWWWPSPCPHCRPCRALAVVIPSSSLFWHSLASLSPPCEQGLAVVGWASFSVSLSFFVVSSLFRCCFVVVPISCTRSHPASRCSWWWGWVLGGLRCPVVVVVVVIISSSNYCLKQVC